MSPVTIRLRAQIISEIKLFTEQLQAGNSIAKLQAIRERIRDLVNLLDELEKKEGNTAP